MSPKNNFHLLKSLMKNSLQIKINFFIGSQIKENPGANLKKNFRNLKLLHNLDKSSLKITHLFSNLCKIIIFLKKIHKPKKHNLYFLQDILISLTNSIDILKALLNCLNYIFLLKIGNNYFLHFYKSIRLENNHFARNKIPFFFPSFFHFRFNFIYYIINFF